MRILIALSRFTLGGTETYSVAVAEQLERLGHTVTLHAVEANAHGRELADSRGLRLAVGDPADLDAVDAALIQDAASAYRLAGCQPGVPQVFVIHGLAAFEHPPADPPPTVVALNDRIARHAEALASRPKVVRLRQPIDLEQFRPRGASRERARRVLLLSNYLDGPRMRLLKEVCRDLELELTRLGSAGKPTIAPQAAMTDADIVVGYGRSIVEAMAMGRAAYVWDRAGGDGWVTSDNYAALEADGFAGAATGDVIDGERLRADFAAYRPELGTFAFDLARVHHSSAKHAEALLGLFDQAGAPADGEAIETLARLVRLEFRAAVWAGGLEVENRRLREELEEARERADAAESAAAKAEGSSRPMKHRILGTRRRRKDVAP
ncbi:MAG TPA: hypothetical protein VFX45_02015 [Solirubrobacterales bacterium]|nr:hypothetical protein [Solirubrobacterales bacterium]